MRYRLKILSLFNYLKWLNRKSMRRTRKPVLTTTLLYVLVMLGTNILACQFQQEPSGQHYELKGTVVSVDPQQQVVVISHDEIVGYMEAMTMPFALKQQWAYKTLTPGDRVQATLVVSGDRSWLEQLVITKKSEAPPNTSNVQPAADLGAKLGDDLPDFSLVNQDAQPIQLRQYRGKALIVTFIYTRCPLPNFCPKMTGNFAEIHRTLQQQPEVYEKTHLLSISFDYAYDTPEVLRAYGAAFAGSNSPETFAHWEFATGSAAEVRAVTQFFGLVYIPETGQIAHSLCTAVIAPDSKVFKVYTDNLWTPVDILRDVDQVLGR